jgi:hypothetical protein
MPKTATEMLRRGLASVKLSLQHFCPNGMNRHRFVNVYLAFIAIWMQIIAPFAMANARPDADPFTVICHHASTAPNDGSHPVRSSTDHDCCTLCHAQLGALPIEAKSFLTYIDYPAGALLKWRISSLPPRAGPLLDQHGPRGPPSLV